MKFATPISPLLNYIQLRNELIGQGTNVFFPNQIEDFFNLGLRYELIINTSLNLSQFYQANKLNLQVISFIKINMESVFHILDLLLTFLSVLNLNSFQVKT